ncbi:kinase-like domain-containing protein [Aspergillus californicus]
MVPLQHPEWNDTADFGDYAETEDDEDDIDEDCEPCHRYDIEETSRLFYPIYLGEVLNGRYLVEHKIVYGGFSTVWMARDLQDERDIAIKVMCLGAYAEHESRMQDKISNNVMDTSHLVMALDTFMIEHEVPGEDARQHKVLVLPLLGPCLDSYIIFDMPLASRMSAARQLLEALEALHEAVIPGLLRLCSDTRQISMNGTAFGVMKPLHDLDRKAYLRTEKFYLTDFGLAMNIQTDAEAKKGWPDMKFCSRERLHHKPPSSACDIWSYMVIFGQLYLRFPPFTEFGKGSLSSIVRTLGPFLEEWRGLYTQHWWYDQSLTLDPKHDLAS